jgi:hypothetical protein
MEGSRDIAPIILYPANLPAKKKPAVTVIYMLYDNSVCSVETNRLALFREIMAVCCGNCRKHIIADFVAIQGLMLKCWAHNI